MGGLEGTQLERLYGHWKRAAGARERHLGPSGPGMMATASTMGPLPQRQQRQGEEPTWGREAGGVEEITKCLLFVLGPQATD